MRENRILFGKVSFENEGQTLCRGAEEISRQNRDELPRDQSSRCWNLNCKSFFPRPILRQLHFTWTAKDERIESLRSKGRDLI